jgi:predicted ArsR family transcriptional regulator
MEQMSSTRERFITLLATHPYTVDDLAKEISVTKNAVRAQITLLARERMVEIQGASKSARRPAALYGLSPGSDLYFSRAYPVILSHLILTFANQLSKESFIKIMQELGQRLARSIPRPSEDPRKRIQVALNFLKALDSPGQRTEEDGKTIITNFVCPIARAVAADPRVCTALETLLRELTGLPVEEHCNRGERQSCRFMINASHDNKLPVTLTEGITSLKGCFVHQGLKDVGKIICLASRSDAPGGRFGKRR